ncbi:hypothetical protein Leryth_011121 [Lithospermum erythrorhizon]|nr:hypothetical protein Leryth_011121 [Lithospermum erythrorhizon]
MFDPKISKVERTDHSLGAGSIRSEKENKQTRPTESMKVDNAPEGRYRHKCNPSKVYAISNTGRRTLREHERVEVLRETGFGSILGICNWKSIPSCFVKWVVENFEPESMHIRLNQTKVLKLTEADVERVYGLPRFGRHIDLSKCKMSSIKKLRSEIGLEGDYSDMVEVNEIEQALTNLDDAIAWSKAAIIYILGCLLCPTNNPNISLNYAHVLDDFENLSKYNWCKHVLEHIRNGIPEKGFKNPKADFHFLLINYLDRMGKESPLLKGVAKGPTLYGWDIKTSMHDLAKINELMGLERGITCGVTKIRQDEPIPAITVIAFDADTCPIEKAPEYASYCKGQIEIFSTCLKTLKRRMKDEGEETVEHETTDESEEVKRIRKRKRRQCAATVKKTQRNVVRRNSKKPMPAENSDENQEPNTNNSTNPRMNTKQNELVEVPKEFDMASPAVPPIKIEIEVTEPHEIFKQYERAEQTMKIAITPSPIENSGVIIDEVDQPAKEEKEQSLDDMIAIAGVLGR